ncbi:MAG TPA: hypothetical protein VEM58_15125 [Streptosporangiaceae bacterium]|nr:hypothetical protein [Streptosporangiaceae bacterium]
MHPQIMAMVAAEHVKDMRAAADRGRRVREARRARRGVITINAARHSDWQAAQVPCPQLPCPPLSARAA